MPETLDNDVDVAPTPEVSLRERFTTLGSQVVATTAAEKVPAGGFETDEPHEAYGFGD